MTIDAVRFHSFTLTMTDVSESHIPLTDSLRSDVLLLSTYLSGQQTSSFKPHSVHDNLNLFVDISTLLAIGNNLNHPAQSAVMGKATPNAIEFLVCAVDAKAGATKNASGVDGIGGLGSGPAGSTCSARENDERSGRSAEDVGDLIYITPSMENGRKLLDIWDLETPIKEGVTDNLVR